jgi:hypothetical protein
MSFSEFHNFQKPGQEALSTIQFSCTVEQLQVGVLIRKNYFFPIENLIFLIKFLFLKEFVYKLKEATKNIEKIT